MSNRWRCFTVDEALAAVLDVEDDSFFGGTRLSDDEGDEDGVGGRRHVQRTVDVDTNSDSDRNSSDEDYDDHYLDQEMDVRRSVKVFVPLASDSSESEREEAAHRMMVALLAVLLVALLMVLLVALLTALLVTLLTALLAAQAAGLLSSCVVAVRTASASSPSVK